MVAHMSAHHTADKHSNGSRRPQSRGAAHSQNTPGSSLPQQTTGTPRSSHSRAPRPTTGDREKEKPPSKDGAAQRAAQDVAGLKDYVRGPPSPLIAVVLLDLGAVSALAYKDNLYDN